MHTVVGLLVSHRFYFGGNPSLPVHKTRHDILEELEGECPRKFLLSRNVSDTEQPWIVRLTEV